MKFLKVNQKHKGLLTTEERLEFYSSIENYLPIWAHADKHKLEFAKEFMKRLELSRAEEGDTVQLGPMDRRTFEYFILSILVEFDYGGWGREANFDC